MSQEADNFNITRKITVVNIRTDNVLFEMIGTFSIQNNNADELEVYLKKSEDFYILRFIDDGKGFDMNAKKDSGFGLRNIRERIAGLGGNVRIISFPGEGTSVEIRIPLITGG